MPFATAVQVRTTINNAELVINRAIQDGTILEVMVAMKGILYLAPPIPGGLHRSPGGLVESTWTPPGMHLIDYKSYYIT